MLGESNVIQSKVNTSSLNTRVNPTNLEEFNNNQTTSANFSYAVTNSFKMNTNDVRPHAIFPPFFPFQNMQFFSKLQAQNEQELPSPGSDGLPPIPSLSAASTVPTNSTATAALQQQQQAGSAALQLYLHPRLRAPPQHPADQATASSSPPSSDLALPPPGSPPPSSSDGGGNERSRSRSRSRPSSPLSNSPRGRPDVDRHGHEDEDINDDEGEHSEVMRMDESNNRIDADMHRDDISDEEPLDVESEQRSSDKFSEVAENLSEKDNHLRPENLVPKSIQIRKDISIRTVEDPRMAEDKEDNVHEDDMRLRDRHELNIAKAESNFPTSAHPFPPQARESLSLFAKSSEKSSMMDKDPMAMVQRYLEGATKTSQSFGASHSLRNPLKIDTDDSAGKLPDSLAVLKQLSATTGSGPGSAMQLMDSPLMAAMALQQLQSQAAAAEGGEKSPGLGADNLLLQQAQAVQFLAQLQSLIMLNPLGPLGAKPDDDSAASLKKHLAGVATSSFSRETLLGPNSSIAAGLKASASTTFSTASPLLTPPAPPSSSSSSHPLHHPHHSMSSSAAGSPPGHLLPPSVGGGFSNPLGSHHPHHHHSVTPPFPFPPGLFLPTSSSAAAAAAASLAGLGGPPGHPHLPLLSPHHPPSATGGSRLHHRGPLAPGGAGNGGSSGAPSPLSWTKLHQSVRKQPQRLDLPPDESANLEELEAFSKMFKQKRIKLGYTQGDVGLAMGKMYGNDFSQTTISRFEALNLSFKNMCKLKPLLERWLKDADANHSSQQQQQQQHIQYPSHHLLTPAQQEAINRRRKKRTSIDSTIRIALERAFNQNSKPTSEEIYYISESLNMEKEVVRVWFCNRRQKEKRMNPNSNMYEGSSPSNSSSPVSRCNMSPLPSFPIGGPMSPPQSSPVPLVFSGHAIFGAAGEHNGVHGERCESP